jgi:hypothetical protein
MSVFVHLRITLGTLHSLSTLRNHEISENNKLDHETTSFANGEWG